jgi:hypothetical protein
VPAAFGVENQVVLSVSGRILLTILRAKVWRIGRQALHRLPVDVVVEQGNLLLAVVDQLDAGGFGEGHRPEAIVGGPILDLDGQAVDLHAPAETGGEKVAHRGFDIRFRPAIPVDPKEHLAMVGRTPRGPGMRLRTQEGHPDVADDPGALQIGHDVCLARGHTEVVAVRVGIRQPVRQLGRRRDAVAAPLPRLP